MLRWTLRMGHAAQSVIGASAVRSMSQVMKSVVGDNMAEWTADMPHAAESVPKTTRSGAQAVYFPSCISRTMGRLPSEPHDRSLMEVILELGRRAGVPLYIPDDVAGTCCGTPFSSKGLSDAHEIAVNHAIERCWAWSEQGRLPIVVDTSPCTYGFRNARGYLSDENQQRFDQMTFLDSIEFAHDSLLPKLRVSTKSASVALHPVCSVTKLGIAPKLEAIARACSDKVLVPLDAGCCAFAGDRGFLVPELDRVSNSTGSDRSERQATGSLLLQQPNLRNRHDARHRTGLSLVSVFTGEIDAVARQSATAKSRARA